MKKRFTQEQIAFALRQADSGTPVAEVVRRMGISEPTFYRWKKKYGGLGVAEIRRLRQLEDENKRLPPEMQLEPVTSLSEPNFSQIDLRLYRPFPFADQRGAGEIYIQIFNLLDRVNYGMVYGRIDSPLFGTGITLAGPPRTIELGLRFTY